MPAEVTVVQGTFLAKPLDLESPLNSLKDLESVLVSIKIIGKFYILFVVDDVIMGEVFAFLVDVIGRQISVQIITANC